MVRISAERSDIKVAKHILRCNRHQYELARVIAEVHEYHSGWVISCIDH